MNRETRNLNTTLSALGEWAEPPRAKRSPRDNKKMPIFADLFLPRGLTDGRGRGEGQP